MTADANRASLLRPIVGIENRTAQEVFDIMCDRFRLAALPAPDHAGLASRVFYPVNNPSAWPDGFNQNISDLLREAATALSAASPAPLEEVPGELAELIAWLRERAKPDSGLRYGDNSIGTAEATVFGYDAAFVAEHFHGEGAAHLARILSAIVGSAK